MNWLQDSNDVQRTVWRSATSAHLPVDVTCC